MYISSLSSNGYKCKFARRFDARIERVHLSSVLLKVLITFILLFVFSCVRLYFSVVLFFTKLHVLKSHVMHLSKYIRLRAICSEFALVQGNI